MIRMRWLVPKLLAKYSYKNISKQTVCRGRLTKLGLETVKKKNSQFSLPLCYDSLYGTTKLTPTHFLTDEKATVIKIRENSYT